jgi:hypothetical protein
MFREEIIDILNKSKPLRWDNEIYYFLYKINPDESLVKADYNDIGNMVNGIKEALSPYNIDEGELLLPYKIIVYEFFDSSLAIKEYDCIYKANNLNVIFDYVSMRRTKTYGADSIRLVYFDNLAVVTKMKNGSFISLPISMPIDYLPSSESLVLQCKDFLIARDFVRESEQYDKVGNKTLTYQDVMGHSSRNEVLFAKWKRLNDITKYVKINKYSFKELTAILKVKQKVTDAEFVRFVNWYAQVHRKEYFTKYKTTTYRSEYWLYIYASYVVSRCKISLPERYIEDGFYMGMSLLKDTINMLAKLKEKSEVSARSIDGLRRYHDEVLARYLELGNKISKKKIKLTKEWKHVKDNLEKSSLNVTILDSEYLLAEEGKQMKNCVRSYYDFVKSGNSLIFHVDYKRKGYCCELKMSEGLPYIAQLLGACNSSDVPKNLVDKITKIIERKN